MIRKFAFSLLAGICTAFAAEASAVDHVTIPFHMEARSNLPTIDATVNGQPVSLLLDLGGHQNLAIKDSAAKRLALVQETRTVKARNSQGQSEDTPLLSIKTLAMGNMTVNSIEGKVLAGQEGLPQDGYVGLGLLQKYLLVFDYPKKELRLYQGGLAWAMERECGASTFPITLDDGVIESNVTVNGKALHFVWDTGSSWNLIRPSSVGLKPEPQQPGHLPRRYEASSVVLGNKNYGAMQIPLMEFSAPDADGFLGTPFFESHVVCVDAATRKAAIR